MSTSCPICGSVNLSEASVTKTVKVPYGPEIEYENTLFTCEDCGEEGDFRDDESGVIEKAVSESKRASVVEILSRLSEEGINNSYFERALRLPFRTVARWKRGEFSAAALALLRFVRTYPWLLDVADDGFDEEKAAWKLVEEAALSLHLRAEKTNTLVTLNLESADNAVSFYGSISPPSTSSGDTAVFIEGNS